ncbi:hypothetical protein CesoFtcFv8_023685 [Champsocephalus esox]|uniref:Uncharacterized protein n=1 Tax=Champsocephalus esox TaxID=159716 RepID=A0AAN8B597_9TELE|nr:hypothetical protein CesoFtcFv8_023685 [Champsocephalus esox]
MLSGTPCPEDGLSHVSRSSVSVPSKRHALKTVCHVSIECSSPKAPCPETSSMSRVLCPLKAPCPEDGLSHVSRSSVSVPSKRHALKTVCLMSPDRVSLSPQSAMP